jgi:regulator of sigma E protease
MDQFLSNVFYIIVALAALLFMVTIHELGHYTAGKLLKFKINEFAIGFGRPLFKRVSKKSGEVFSLRLIPLGGFCAFEGEDQEKDNPQAFNNQKPWKRIIVLLSGVTFNFLFSLLLCIFVFNVFGMLFPKAEAVYPDAGTAVSEEYKLREGDILLAINGKTLYLANDLQKELAGISEGEVFTVTVARGGQRQDVTVKKRQYAYTDENGKEQTAYGLGIRPSYAPYNMGFFGNIAKSVIYCFKMAGVLLGYLGQLITGKASLSDIGGPITTIGVTAQIASKGLFPLLEIVIFIGVNLAVFNLLPIPALDGARIVFIIIEWLRGKPIKREIEGKIHFAGFILLIGLVLFADLFQLISKIFT